MPTRGRVYASPGRTSLTRERGGSRGTAAVCAYVCAGAGMRVVVVVVVVVGGGGGA
ncbi:hypothetical protein MYCTH_2304838 [Thermothelomyces thermophilus ATCC 42464]|uniref:Uncharacterized protein n=1 Tax=Thermothelomyces thermophilus (strain ATCC 42464 / BCRC 31852 / DSM 1799) TaxID=573729 RepID=G2QBM0_THET4|nr:uncharacterized protein MYCTH_2304838 [Thermothelomyces thermophilus ATCC 42464]AEO57963.1 hypothetical protein MYCTH_2304838 [Thermothelomyces thermophilus ATCC 42464]